MKTVARLRTSCLVACGFAWLVVADGCTFDHSELRWSTEDTGGAGGIVDAGGGTSADAPMGAGGVAGASGTTGAGGAGGTGGAAGFGGTIGAGGIGRAGGISGAGGATASGGITTTPTGTIVTFANGQAQGAMTGRGWISLGTEDSISNPTCGGTVITSSTDCANITWSSATALCITGSIPALYNTNNWGILVGVNSTAPAGSGLGQSFTSITITVTSSPPSGLHAIVHRKSDPNGTNYYAILSSGTPLAFTSFNSHNDSPPDGVFLTAADIPNIDQIGVVVPSTTSTIVVTNLCITGIAFTR